MRKPQLFNSAPFYEFLWKLRQNVGLTWKQESVHGFGWDEKLTMNKEIKRTVKSHTKNA